MVFGVCLYYLMLFGLFGCSSMRFWWLVVSCWLVCCAFHLAVALRLLGEVWVLCLCFTAWVLCCMLYCCFVLFDCLFWVICLACYVC